MRNNIFNWMKLSSFIFALSALFASCSNELDDALQPVENGTLQFVVSDFPAFGDGAQTRAIGTPDAGKTEWETNDKITVTFTSAKYGEQTATLTYGEDGTWASSGTLSYLENETPTVSAVYNPSDTPGVGEYLVTTDYTIADNTLKISFANAERTYSRLRIAGLANQTLTVTTANFTPAGPEGATAPESYTLTTDDKGNAYLYGAFAEGATATVKKGDAELITYPFIAATVQGNSYALFAGVTVDLSELTETYVINDSKNYHFTGTGSYGIKVESGNPTIILNNANITVGEEYDFENIVNAIDIVADNSETTVWVMGTNNLTSNCGAGIYVKSGSTVIIKSDSRDNVLTAQAGFDGAGIGGTGYDSAGNTSCGNIYIENVTVNAYGCAYMDNSPGIGDANSCGTISIKNAAVTARGSAQAAEMSSAIGSRTVPDIIIENSTVNAYRGGYRSTSYADWIGAIRHIDDGTTPGIQCGNGYIKNTTVNKYMYDLPDMENIEEGFVTYDADGKVIEN